MLMKSKKVNLDWKCVNCSYINFKRNLFCKKCYTDKDGNEYLFNDWICHQCLKLNEIDYHIGKIKTNLACDDCGHLYSLQNINNLPYKLCTDNNFLKVKDFYSKLGIFVDWDCLQNINKGMKLCIKLITRNYISKNTILYGIQNIVIARNPFTSHSISCTCDGCDDLN